MNGDVPHVDNLVDYINRLAEPPVPAPVPLTPETGGWVVLAILLALALLALVWWVVRRRRANAYRRAALIALAAAGDDPAEIAAILRRTALAAWPRTRVASLTGEAWLGFLDASGGDGAFKAGPGRAIVEAPFRADAAPAPGLAEAAEQWVRHHRHGADGP
ncbi:DUF4381 domain-containing protein [Acuticoccus kandeliae]|uniref:DUF4381 domain-containing protein n=1 Tax=Acuticoccus kandeliae TaxID=2073160 RepID=UPI000D3EE03F|nr:DUF4381 domain-containing protein [Acuticoccus kandeliae]